MMFDLMQINKFYFIMIKIYDVEYNYINVLYEFKYLYLLGHVKRYSEHIQKHHYQNYLHLQGLSKIYVRYV